MPALYNSPPDATLFTEEDDLTEQEHKDSCDINIMMKNLHSGLQVRGSHGEPIYGEDDTTMTGLQFRIDKQRLEEELTKTAAEHEFTEAELAIMPEKVAEKFRFKKKADQKPVSKNDDKTTKQDSVQSQQKEPKNATDPKTTVE